jgi:hypothetical protein
MSSNYTKTMLQTLKQYQNSQITLTFNNKFQIPQVTVCCFNNSYKVFHLESQLTETYEDIETAMTAIERTINNSHFKPLVH